MLEVKNMIIVLKKDHLALFSLLCVMGVCLYLFGTVGVEEQQVVASDKKTVIIDAGHGGEDPGAVSDYSGACEKDINLTIAKSVEALLKKDGYNVLMTRTEDKLVYPAETTGYTAKRKADLTRRKEFIDSSDASIAVCIHLNKFQKTQYWGAQTFYPHNSDESKRLAESIQAQIKKTADPQNERAALVRGKPNDLPIMLFRDLVKPTVVVECGFLSNEEDEKRLTTKEYQDKLALAVKDGIIEYLK